MFAYCLNNPVMYKDSSGTFVLFATLTATAVAEMLFGICVSALLVAAVVEIITIIAQVVYQYSPAKETSPSENVVNVKSVSTPANPEPPNNNGRKNDNQGKGSFKKITEQQLKRYGLDAHKIKYDILGKKAQISRYNMYYNTKTGEIFLLRNGTSHFIQTGYFIH